ncbi:MAG TPA: Hsp20/alpha crystallin family protein [Opitutaceae bacterium]|jgi:HSP20 family protein
MSPWAGLETEIDRLFESTLSGVAGFAGGARNQFPVDIYEDRDNTYVRAELPGVSRADANVEMVDDYLTITAVRKEKAEEDSFSFSRSLTIPEHVQTDKVSARYEDGVLTVTLPKREEAKPRKVSVAING